MKKQEINTLYMCILIYNYEFRAGDGWFEIASPKNGGNFRMDDLRFIQKYTLDYE